MPPSAEPSSFLPEDTSTPTHKSKSRVPRPRNRHAPSTPNSIFGSATPALCISSDPTQFLMTLKGVSEKVRVDESRLGLAKKRAINGRIAKTNRRGSEKENLRRTASDVDKRPSVLVNSPVIAHRSLPNFDPGVDVEMANEGSSGMDIDVDERLEHHTMTKSPRLSPQRVMPPPPVPLAKLKLLKSNPAQVQGPVTPNSKPKSITPPTPISPYPPKQPPPTAPPRSSQPSSQSQRLPALGMRRHRQQMNSSQAVILPERRKGFKVPLAKPKLEPELETKQEDVLPTPESSQHTAMQLHDPQPNTIPIIKADNKKEILVLSEEPDADSSFGDLSFDMDADALEETMRKYD